MEAGGHQQEAAGTGRGPPRDGAGSMSMLLGWLRTLLVIVVLATFVL